MPHTVSPNSRPEAGHWARSPCGGDSSSNVQKALWALAELGLAYDSYYRTPETGRDPQVVASAVDACASNFATAEAHLAG